ncbi:MAG: DNA polymerase III subunit delta' C-terminal domain-containing protein [Bacillota bacterium]
MGMMAIPGAEPVARLLLGQLNRGRLSHAYAFTGPRPDAQLAMARQLAKALHCAAPDPRGDSCDRCVPCRRIEHGNFPAFQVFGAPGESIKIEHIRSIQQFLAVTSEAKTKVYVLNGADQLTVQAANSLLKIIEEPPAPAVAILIARHRKQLLPTIASRCQEVAFPVASPQQWSEELKAAGIPAMYAPIFAHLEMGPQRASACMEGEGFAEAIPLVIQWGEEVLRHPVPAMTTLQTLLQAGREDWAIDLLMLWLRDLLLMQSGQEELLAFSAYRPQLEQQAKRWPQEALLFFLDGFFSLQRMKKNNLNWQLAVEDMMLRMPRQA